MATGGDDTPALFKFPRTRHLFDAGGHGVSRDDLLMDRTEAAAFYSKRGGPQTVVTVEEKVDGANLGISIAPSDYRIMVQNRAHYVNSQTHKQFALLDQWLDEHSAALFDVIEPGRHVLYGEWLYAKHSIHYTRLPGYFLAFDIYDRKAGRFLSRRARNRRLESSGIPTVRMIAECPIRDQKHVLQLLDSPSGFYDGPCEGLYLRIDDDVDPQKEKEADHFLLKRTKVVRPDFLQQIEEQWTRQKLTKNIVVFH